MRISDWSSDVCSSDLALRLQAVVADARRALKGAVADGIVDDGGDLLFIVAQRAQRQRHRAVDDLEVAAAGQLQDHQPHRSEEHTSELQPLMRISYAVFCLKKKITTTKEDKNNVVTHT